MTELEKQIVEDAKKELFLAPLNSKEELRDWVYTFLDITLPFGNVSGINEDISSDIIYGSPGDAIWEAYNTYKQDLYKENPGYIWMANRDGGKTLAGSILNVLLICQFKAEIAHLAAVKKQAEKCIEYTTIFIRKLTPYINHVGRKVISDSKHKIQILNEDGTVSFIDVIVASLAGGNSQRAHVGSYDELDTLSKQGLIGYKEAQLIPTRKNEHGPMTVKYSTRKFSFGIFEKEIQNRHISHEKLVQWNVLDITEKCFDDRSLKSTGNINIRYTKKQLPALIKTQEEMDKVISQEKSEYRKIELYDGCLKCPLAATCQGRLTLRPDTDLAGAGSLFKTIDFTVGQFRKTDSEMAEAQLLCWKPTSAGLVYSRFSETLGDNIVSVAQAYEIVTGEIKEDITFDELVAKIKDLGIKVFAGVDFGFTHDSTIIIVAVLPDGNSLLLDTYGSPGLETHDFADIASNYQEKYGVWKWFLDQAAPSAIKTFRKKGMNCPDFKKDVMGGISAIRSQIITSTGVRKFKVVKTVENESSIKMLKEHHFLLDNAGNVTTTPDDDIGIADRADALRYIGQNVFDSKSGKMLISGDYVPIKTYDSSKGPISPNEVNKELMKQEITQRAGISTTSTGSTKKKGGLRWDF